MMFEKAKPPHARSGVPSGGLTAEERARLRALAGAGADERFVARSARRSGDAMRALEWSELTARLNAARDLRLRARVRCLLISRVQTLALVDEAIEACPHGTATRHLGGEHAHAQPVLIGSRLHVGCGERAVLCRHWSGWSEVAVR